MTGNILLVEDEEHLARGLKFNLEAEGFKIQVAGDGETALDLLLTQQEQFDLLVLDVMLPGKDGFTVATELRKANHSYSAADAHRARPPRRRARRLRRRRRRLSAEAVRLEHSAGAHPEPAAPTRMGSHAGHRSADQSRVAEPKAADSLREFDVYAFAGKQVDFGTLELRANGKIFRLTLMEAELLRHLIASSGKIVSRKQILEEVWGLHEDTDTRAIDNFIVRLRKYIEKDPSNRSTC